MNWVNNLPDWIVGNLHIFLLLAGVYACGLGCFAGWLVRGSEYWRVSGWRERFWLYLFWSVFLLPGVLIAGAVVLYAYWLDTRKPKPSK